MILVVTTMMKHDKIHKTIPRMLRFLFICMLLFVGKAEAQTFEISGRVLDDETGDPLIGASVIVKDTHLGCVTDWNGSFKLSGISSERPIIIISYIGMKTEERVAHSGMMEIRLPT